MKTETCTIANDPEFKELVFAFKDAKVTNFGVLGFNSRYMRDRVKSEFEKALPNIKFIEVDLSGKSFSSLYQLLQKTLPQPALASEPVTYIVNLLGLEDCLYRNKDGVLEPTGLIPSLNFERELLFRSFPFSIVVWTDMHLVAQLRKKAVDLWSWVTCYHDFSREERRATGSLAKPLQGKHSDSSLTWLHLSDLHFWADDDWQQKKALRTLFRDVVEKLPEQDLLPDLVFITGDIAFSGKMPEYEKARAFFEHLAAILGHDPGKQWFVVPGNHDVNREGIKGLERSLRSLLTDQTNTNKILEDEAAWSHFAARQSNFLNFTKTFLGSRRAWSEKNPWRVELYEKFGLKVAVLCLNTAWASQDDEDRGNLLLGECQIRDALNQASSFQPHLKVCLFHHPMDWLKTFDGDRARSLLKGPYGCQIILHGHVHVWSDSPWDPTSNTLEMAVGPTWKNEDAQQTVLVSRLDLETKRGTVYGWSYSPQRGGFWAPSNPMREMEDGCWSFELPAAWNLPTVMDAIKQVTKADRKILWEGPLVPGTYRRFLVSGFRNIDTLVNSESGRSIRLSAVYVDLETDWLEPEKRKTAKDPFREEISGRRPLDELLSLEPYHHFVLVGEPGCGKSTFLQKTALTEVDSARFLPLILRLVDFGNWLHDIVDDQPRLLLQWASAVLRVFSLDEEALEGRLKAGKVLWLLDGLDEIYDPTIRLRIATIIGRFCKSDLGRKNRIFVTTRPHTLQEPRLVSLLNLHDTIARILPLKKESQLSLLQLWFSRLFGQDSAVRIGEMCARLWHSLEHKPLLGELRANPLMLSVIATIFYMGKVLPERRADFYKRSSDLLLQRRFGPLAGGSTEKALRFSNVLSRMASTLMEKGSLRGLPEDDFLRILSQVFFPEEKASNRNNKQLLELAKRLASQSGLLIVRGDPPTYGFSHLGFLEYFAARKFAQERNPEEALAAHIDDSRWREVILLVAGYFAESGPSFLVENFILGLKRLWETEPTKINRLVLAILASAELPNPAAISHQLREELQHSAVKLLETSRTMAPEKNRIDLGMTLGLLGDPRLGMDRYSRWVWIEPGTFAMGSDTGQESGPIHRVSISTAFSMGKYPVTHGEFDVFIKEGGYENRRWWTEEGWLWLKSGDLSFKLPLFWNEPAITNPNQPVIGISWHEAQAFCRWLNSSLRETKPKSWPDSFEIRLPTEAEWEFAARGTQSRTYPWGEAKPDNTRANFGARNNSPTPIGIYPSGRTPEGVEDLAGNIWEWCLDSWDFEAYRKRVAGVQNPLVSEPSSKKVIRGGSWLDGAEALDAGHRNWAEIDTRSNRIGFRCIAVPIAPPLATWSGEETFII